MKEESENTAAITGRNAMKVKAYQKQAIASEKKRKIKRKNRKRKTAEHRGLNWFAVETMLDPKDIEAVPINDSGFMLGSIDDMIVVEYPKSMPPQKIREVGTAFGALGVKCLMVPQGFKFLQLRGCTVEEEKKLNAIAASQNARLKKMLDEAEANAESAEGPSDE